MLKQIQSLCIGNVDMSYTEVRHGGMDHISYFKHINKRHSFFFNTSGAGTYQQCQQRKIRQLDPSLGIHLGL